jgi:arylsulfatase A-like enzyme
MTQPNVLYVFDDQHRYSAMGSSGNSVVKTPHLDRLAGEGIVLDQVFSSCPICGPYRGQLMTGRYSHCNGVLDNEYSLSRDQAFLPQALKESGYTTGYVGKWHLGYPPYGEAERHGFDYMAAYDCRHSYYKTEYYENEIGPHAMKGWAPEVETDLAIGFMERSLGMPFCLVMSWGPPHWPYDEYPEEFKIYDADHVDLPRNVPEQMAGFAAQELADYYGNITALDDQFGRLIGALDRLGIADNTIVVFTSDHGDHLSSHGYGKPMDHWMHPSFRASKATPYDESIHVPFVARWPGTISAGTRSDAIVSSVDMMPTILSLCGAETPVGVQGTDQSHHLLGSDGPRTDSAYLQILGPGWPHRGEWVGFWRGIRTERWVYARWFNDQYGPMLFDRDNDPDEMLNLADDPSYSDVRSRLEARLLKWMDDTDDPFDTGARSPDSGILELGQSFNHPMYDRKG